jgi:replicative DNA helicase
LGLNEIIVVGCWYTWWQRRELLKGGRVSSPGSTTFAINALAANYEVARLKSQLNEVMWSIPKLNIDAAFHSDGSGAACVVLRGGKGEAVARMTCPLQNIISTTSTEATTPLKGFWSF